MSKATKKAARTIELEDCGRHHASPECHHVDDCSWSYCGRDSREEELRTLLQHCREATDDPLDANEPYSYVATRLAAILGEPEAARD
jgi:hypothetical protein